MARFCTLFSGSNGNSTYISGSDTALLVDAGRSCKQLMSAMDARGIDPKSIQAILITHEHTDHVSGLRVFLKKIKVPVYAAREVLDRLCWDNIFSPEQPLFAVEDGARFQVGALEIESFDTPHDSVHSLGYRISTPDGRRLTVATDLGYISDPVRERLTGSDLVLIESNYDQRMLSVSDYPYQLKKRIASNIGHLSNEDCSGELSRLVRTKQQSSRTGLPDRAVFPLDERYAGRPGLSVAGRVAFRPVRNGGTVISLQIIAVGKLKDAWMREGCAEYCKRLGMWSSVSVVEVEEYRLPDHPSPAQIAECVEKEGERILAKLPKGACTVAMCIEGKMMSSERLAAYLQKTAVDGVSTFALVIGGSYGLSERVKASASLRLSMSPMTFPHQLARVMLLEQLYRALSINANAKYHK